MNNNNHTTVDYLLIGRYFSGEASPEEAIQLEEWISADTANKQQFEQLSKVWSTISSEEPCIVPDKEAFFNQVRDKFPPQHSSKLTSFTKTITWVKIAAAVLIIAGAAILVAVLNKNDQRKLVHNIIRQTQQTILHDTLPDGSLTVISNYSWLQYPQAFTGTTREVQLNGEAWFEITPNAAQPFIITAGPLHIKLIGTSFNVRSINDVIEVSVKTGVVRMYDSKDSLTVNAGQKGIYQITARQFTLKETFNLNEVAYATKHFNFENAPLKEITDQLQKAYGITIVITNKDLENCRLTSSFENQPIEHIFDVLAITLSIHYRIEHKTVYISGSSCK